MENKLEAAKIATAESLISAADTILGEDGKPHAKLPDNSSAQCVDAHAQALRKIEEGNLPNLHHVVTDDRSKPVITSTIHAGSASTNQTPM